MSASLPETPPPDAPALLRRYLNDHRAAGTAGLALARRSRSSNEGNELGEVLAVIVREIEEDAALLDRFARSHGVRLNPVKAAGARAGVTVGQLKLNGRLRGYSPLSRVIELEALMAGIDARCSLWTSLGQVVPPTGDGPDFTALAERARDQRRRLRPHHEAAARAAFGGAVCKGAEQTRTTSDSGSSAP